MTGFAALPLRHRALFVLLLVGSAWTGFVFASHAATQPAAGGMWLSLIGFVALALVTLYAIGQRKAWAPWTALAVASGMLVIALYGWATRLDAIWPPVTAALAIAAIGVAFLIGEARIRRPHPAAAHVLCDHFLVPGLGRRRRTVPARADRSVPAVQGAAAARPIHRRHVHRRRRDDAAGCGVTGLARRAGRDGHPRHMDRHARHRVVAARQPHSTGAGVRPGSGGLPISGSRSAPPSSRGTSATNPVMPTNRRCRRCCAAFLRSKARSPSCLRSGCCWRRRS